MSSGGREVRRSFAFDLEGGITEAAPQGAEVGTKLVVAAKSRAGSNLSQEVDWKRTNTVAPEQSAGRIYRVAAGVILARHSPLEAVRDDCCCRYRMGHPAALSPQDLPAEASHAMRATWERELTVYSSTIALT